MLRDAFEWIQNRVQAADQLKIIRTPGGDGRQYMIAGADGLQHHTAPPAPRRLTCGTLAALMALAVDPPFPDPDNKRILVYGFGWATLYFDREWSTADQAVWESERTDEHKFFLAARQARGSSLRVEEAVEQFDVQIPNCVPDDKFVEQISRLKIVNEAEEQARVDRTSSMVGGIHETRVAPDHLMPDPLVHFRVRPFASEEFGKRLILNVRVRPNLRDKEWRFIVSEPSWYHYLHEGQNLIGERLDALDASVTRVKATLTQNPPDVPSHLSV